MLSKVLAWGTGGLLGCLFLFIAAQNFLFSSSLGIVFLREVDDAAFQGILRYLHGHLRAGNLKAVLGCTSFGYGNIFWLLETVVTFPFYLAGWERAVAVIPRLVSQCFCFGGLLYLWKWLRLIFKEQDGVWFSLLLIVSFPAFVASSMRFHNQGQIFFLSVLSFYLLYRSPRLAYRDMLWSLFVAGLAVGTKLVGAFMLPVLGLCLMDRTRDTGKGIAELGRALGAFVVGFVLAFQPLLFLFPFFRTQVAASIGEWAHHVSRVSGLPSNPLDRSPVILWRWGFACHYVKSFIWGVLLLGWFVGGSVLRGYRRRLLLYVGLGVSLVMSYLLLRSWQGPTYIGSYFFGVSFLLALGFLGLECIPKPTQLAVGSLVVMLNLYLNWEPIRQYYGFYWDRAAEPRIVNVLNARRELMEWKTPEGPAFVLHVLRTNLALFSRTHFDAHIREDVAFGELEQDNPALATAHVCVVYKTNRRSLEVLEAHPAFRKVYDHYGVHVFWREGVPRG